MVRKLLLKNGCYSNIGDSDYQNALKYFNLTNPAYVQAKSLGVPTAGIDPKISYINYIKDTSLGGAVYRVPRYFEAMHPGFTGKDEVEIVDQRTKGTPLTDLWPGEIFNNLRPHQLAAIQAYMLKNNMHNGSGIIALACGKGKTITALALIKMLRTSTLILVDQLSLAKQWQDQIEKHLGVKPALWIQNKNKVGQITIATLQSLVSHMDSGKLPKDFFENFGFTILDECHVAPAWTFHRVMMEATSRYILGLSATVDRADGLTKAEYAVCGPVVYSDLEAEVDPEIYFEISNHVPSYISSVLKWADTKSQMSDDFKEKWLKRQWPKFLTSLTKCVPRNRIILDLITKDAKDKHVILVLTGRKEHAKELSEQLQKRGISSEFVISECSAKQRELIFKRVREGETQVLLATSIAKKGLDIPNLSCVHLITPVASKEFVIQGIGRALRSGKNKLLPLVRDYVDIELDSAYFMALSRIRTYRSKGWKMHGEDKVARP